jgi:hypothetical protein
MRKREFSAAQDTSRVAGAPDSSHPSRSQGSPRHKGEKATGFQCTGETVKALSHGSIDGTGYSMDRIFLPRDRGDGKLPTRQAARFPIPDIALFCSRACSPGSTSVGGSPSSVVGGSRVQQILGGGCRCRETAFVIGRAGELEKIAHIGKSRQATRTSGSANRCPNRKSDRQLRKQATQRVFLRCGLVGVQLQANPFPLCVCILASNESVCGTLPRFRRSTACSLLHLERNIAYMYNCC